MKIVAYSVPMQKDLRLRVTFEEFDDDLDFEYYYILVDIVATPVKETILLHRLSLMLWREYW